MADISVRNGGETHAVVFCAECGSDNVIHNPKKPPKFCLQCGERLPPPTSSVNHNGKVVDESVKKLEKPVSDKSFDSNKPSPVDLSFGKHTKVIP